MKALLAACALALAGTPAIAQTVSNPDPIAIVDAGEVTSSINVFGIAGNITGLTLSLNDISHTYPDDLVLGLLNVDLGLGFVFMSQVGSGTDWNNIDLTFSDDASTALPESFVDFTPVTSGTYLPSNYGFYEFIGYANALSFADFFGASPNGTWTLFVGDVFPGDTGTIAGGWSLTFTTDATGGAVPEPAAWAMMIGGFGLAGAAMRRRRSVAGQALAA
ncbi:PEPxxWA-CTERM sorting domain-containing protein [Sphingomonas sp. RS6]